MFVLAFVFLHFILQINTTTLIEKRELFKAADTDHNNGLSEEEIYKMIHDTEFENSKKEAESLTKTYDTNHDGFLSLEEYFKYNQDIQDDSPEYHETTFKLADTNGDGKLSVEEMAYILHPPHHGPLNSHILNKSFQALDINHNNVVSLEEYYESDEISDADRKQFRKEWDKNGDGHMDFNEYMESNVKEEESYLKEYLTDIMKASDKNKDGKISEAEFLENYESSFKPILEASHDAAYEDEHAEL